MPTLTTNYFFTKPDIGGSNNSWGAELNQALDQIDTALDGVADRVGLLEARRLPDADGRVLGGILEYRYGTPLANYRIPHIYAVQTTEPTGVPSGAANGALILVYNP